MLNQPRFKTAEPTREVRLKSQEQNRKPIQANRFHIDQLAAELANEWTSPEDSTPQFLN